MALNEMPAEILNLIIRFTAAIPDLSLPIDSPKTTTTLSLKVLIRQHLPSEYAKNRLRLIHSGKILVDDAVLYKSLGLKDSIVPPPSTVRSAKGQGKQPLRAEEPRVHEKYIHCSIGDALSSDDLQKEAIAAEESKKALLDKGSVATTSAVEKSTSSGSRYDAPNTAEQAPLGFDRLLQTGFTAADVATLRASFLSHLAHTHTPDTLPNGDALRRLEDRWLEQDNSNNGGIEGAALDDDEASHLDDMFWGNIWGFFWPVGAIVWGFREEGVWTRRRKIAVFTGLLVNIVFGFARLTSGK